MVAMNVMIQFLMTSFHHWKLLVIITHPTASIILLYQ